MMYGIAFRLARVRFTLSYLAALASVSIALLMLGPQAHERAIRHASTNLHNLAHGRLGTLWNSAFVIDEGPLYFWLPCLACLLALAELHLRTGRLAAAFIVGHLGATLLVASALAGAVTFGWLPWSMTRVSDVGMSYGALAVLGALTATIARRWRPAWVGWWVSLGIAAAITGGGFTDCGHAIALALGMLMTMRFSHPIRWTPPRYALLVASSGFGFLLLAHTTWTSANGLVLGIAGAVAAHSIARRITLRGVQGRRDSGTAPCPVPSG
ncbi:rhomboid-like protein [Mycobacterium basiliense]|nr:rhomboid-like protein [Mycobacterium basiliense]